jgi:hypothetical protein
MQTLTEATASGATIQLSDSEIPVGSIRRATAFLQSACRPSSINVAGLAGLQRVTADQDARVRRDRSTP